MFVKFREIDFFAWVEIIFETKQIIKLQLSKLFGFEAGVFVNIECKYEWYFK